MAGNIGKTTNRLPTAIAARLQEEREDIWGEMDGKILTIDYDRQVADIQPLYMKRLNGIPTALPVLEEVPVRFLRAGGGALTQPVKPGDFVTLRPKMRSSENYRVDGGADGYAASDSRSFNLSDYEAYLDGGESLTDPIPNFDAKNMHIRADPEGRFGVRLSADGKVAIEGKEGNIYTLIAAALRNLAGAKTIVNKGSSTGLYDHDQKAAVLAIADLLDAMAI